jgi:hypothetical protein
MYQESYDENEIVTTEELDWFGLTGSAATIGDLVHFGKNWGVEVIYLGDVKGPGGYRVRFTGEYARVKNMLASEYATNETGVEKEHYVHALMGDKLASHRFSTGCNIGLPGGSPAPSIEKFAWSAHWDQAGIRDNDPSDNPSYDEVNQMAIEALVDAGYGPKNPGFGENNSVDMAQTYLMLAFLHCPDLMNLLDPDKKQESIDDLKSRLHTAIVDGEYGEAQDLLAEIARRTPNEEKGN